MVFLRSRKKSANKVVTKIDDLSVHTENGVAFLKKTFAKEIELKNLNMEVAEVITDGNANKFIGCIANHRFRNREEFRKVPAVQALLRSFRYFVAHMWHGNYFIFNFLFNILAIQLSV
jgi:hypothetical protein